MRGVVSCCVPLPRCDCSRGLPSTSPLFLLAFDPSRLSPGTSLFLTCTLKHGVMLFSPFSLPLTHFSHFLPVKAIIEHEMKNGIPPNRIILGGFSQVRVPSSCSTCHRV